MKSIVFLHGLLLMIAAAGLTELLLPAVVGRRDVSLWNDPYLATGVATAAVVLLITAGWLLRRRSRQGRGAAVVCLIVSVALHLVLVLLLPQLKIFGGGTGNRGAANDTPGEDDLVFAAFEPTAAPVNNSGVDDDGGEPLPLPGPLFDAMPAGEPSTAESSPQRTKATPVSAALPTSLSERVPAAAEPAAMPFDDFLSSWPSDSTASSVDGTREAAADGESERVASVSDRENTASGAESDRAESDRSGAQAGHVPADVPADFANRFGGAKRTALLTTGGDDSTEAAVEAALRFLAADQRPNGSWDPSTSGAGRETMTLGTDRKSAGRRSTTGLTGLALLSMLGAGNTHREGPYAANVHRGLSYLIVNQKPDGSLAGDAELYEATYCHGMAALAMCEAAAMTGDPSALASAAAAVRYTVALQHPVTGGWRYRKGEPGDLSQLGWQAMVLEAGHAAGIPVPSQPFHLTGKFLRSVRGGTHGGLAGYRPGEGPTRTMTAEALASRLLLGEEVPANEVREAQQYLLRQLPGVGRDNYYGWYYTSIALHQLQDDSWRVWNEAMKKHLLARQSPSGSWPTDSEWGGYGGRVYTTSMAALCLEVYYRHRVREAR